VTDSDPYDAAGGGRGSRNRSGATDSDPSDTAGYGRSGRHTGMTDSDPSDRGGSGRGNDSDPYDPAAQYR
jgi:hypothetical protein